MLSQKPSTQTLVFGWCITIMTRSPSLKPMYGHSDLAEVSVSKVPPSTKAGRSPRFQIQQIQLFPSQNNNSFEADIIYPAALSVI